MTGWPYSYAPGTLVGFANGRLVALVGLPTDDELVARIATVVAGEEPSLDAVLDVLISRGLRAVASFGLAELTDAGARVLVRGACRVEAEDHAAASAGGLWAESLWPGVTELRLVTGETDARSLPLAGGIVLASALGFGTHSGEVPAEPASGPAPVPAGQPAQPDGEEPVLAVAPEYDERGDEIPQPVAPPTPEPAGATLASPLTGPFPDADAEADADADADATPEPEPEPAEHPATRHEPAAPASDGFIAAMPWSLEDPVVAPAAAPAAPVGPGQAPDPDLTTDLPARPAALGASDTTVVAVLCPRDHANAVHATTCRVCGAPLAAQQPVEVPRPSLGVLKLANGDVVALERGAVLGRNPRLPQGWTGGQPHLVRIDDPERDVSGQHLEVRLDGWHVLVRDLGSTNGTEVVLPGSEPVLLRAHEQLSIEPGTRIILAGVFEVTYEAAA